MPAGDGRSVGELLAEADRLTRQTLMDLSGDDAPAMLRSWGEVAEAAADLWNAIPGPSPHPERRPGSDLDPMRRLLPAAHALHRYQLRHHWPGDGPTDERLSRVSEALSRAEDLVHRFGGDVHPTRPEVRADLEAARMRIMHTLYVGAHAVTVATRAHLADLERAAGPRPSPQNRRGVLHGTAAVARLAAVEQLAGTYLGTGFAAAAAGEVAAEPDHPDQRLRRLADALTSWDVQAHRTLTHTPTGPNLVLAARTQATITTTTAAILHAAARTGHADTATYTHRLGPALDASQQAWTHAAGRWADLAVPGARTDRDLVAASSELRAAIRDAAHDHTTWASPEQMASRIDLTHAAKIFQQASAASVEVAHLTHDIAAHDHTLTGPARTLATRARDDTEQAIRGGDMPAEAAATMWVNPRDVHGNTQVPLPEPVRSRLIDAAAAAAAASSTATSTMAALDRTSHHSPTSPPDTAGPKPRPRRPDHPSPLAVPAHGVTP